MLPRAQSSRDRRVHTRSPYHGMLQLQCAGDSTWVAVQALDVSAGGFAFMSDVEMRRGERLVVAVPDLDAYTVQAVVRHVQPQHRAYFVGIEFDEPLPPQLEHCLGV